MTQIVPYSRNYDYSRFAPVDLPDVGVRINGDLDEVASVTSRVSTNLSLIQRDDGALRNASVTSDTLDTGLRAQMLAGTAPVSWDRLTSDVQTRITQGSAAVPWSGLAADVQAIITEADGPVSWTRLDSSVRTLIASGNWTPRGTWATGTAYAALDFVQDSATGTLYLCPAGKAHTAGATLAADAALGRWMPISADLSLVSYVDNHLPSGYVPGVSSAVAAVQAAANALTSTGGILRFGAACYKIDAAVTFPIAMRVEGVGFHEGPSGSLGAPSRPVGGTWIWHATVSASAFVVSGFGPGQGIQFTDMAFWQSHPAATAGVAWTPTVYPPTVNVDTVGGMVLLDRLHFHNIYHGLKALGAGRIHIGKIQGQCLSRGIVIDQAYDACWLGQQHWWPFWTSHQSVMDWTAANGVAVELNKVDGWTADWIFGLPYKIALWLNPSVYGGSTRWRLNALYGDSCRHTLVLDQSNVIGSIGLFVGNPTDTAPPNNPLASGFPIIVNGSANSISIDHFDALNCYNTAVYIAGANNRFTFNHFHVESYNTGNVGQYAITVRDSNNAVALGQTPVISSPYPTGLAYVESTARVTMAASVNVAPGNHNVPLMRSAGTGSPVVYGVDPDASDANTSVVLEARGSAPVYLKNGNSTVLYADAPPTAASYVSLLGNVSGSAAIVTVGSADAAANVILQGKSTAGSAIIGMAGGGVGFFGAPGAARQTMSATPTGAEIRAVLAAYNLIVP